MSPAVSPTTLPQLARLRRRLTLWYATASLLIMTLLGASVLWVVGAPLESELHRSLQAVVGYATRQPVDAMPPAAAFPAPGVHVFGVDGRPAGPDSSAAFEPWLRETILRAARDGRAEAEHDGAGGATLFLYAERFTTATGEERVAAAVAGDVELADRYAAVIVAFAFAALFAVLIIAAGGWFLVRVSTTPIEASIGQMRRFVADAAHELRTPLTVLRSRAEVALQQPRDGAAYVGALKGIESDARRLGAIVDDLFVLARADAGERRHGNERIALDDIVVDAANTARLIAVRKGVTVLITEYEEAWVDGDPELLRQLLMILLDNAVKFTPAGGTVTVHVGAEDTRAHVLVEDSGIGIEREHLPQVFDRFFRADPARQAPEPGGHQSGAGLGLSIARWIAQVHGAVITAESEVGRGTRMTVRFPPLAPRHLVGAPDGR